MANSKRRVFLVLALLLVAAVVLWHLAISATPRTVSKPRITTKPTAVEPESREKSKIDDATPPTQKASNSTTLDGYTSVLDPSRPLQTNCVTCSLVSSSGRILDQSKGDEIDEADCVIRMNEAPVKGYEIDVGRRTTLRVLSQFSVSSALRHAQNLIDEKLEFFAAWGAEQHLGDKTAKGRAMIETAKKIPGIGFYRVTPKYYWHQDEIFQKATGKPRQQSGTWLSTGWFTFDVIKLACKRTKVYGMIPEDFCLDPSAPKALYHYWQRSAGDECSYYRGMENRRSGAHRFMTEKAIFARWAITHNITFHSPEWDPREHTEAHHNF